MKKVATIICVTLISLLFVSPLFAFMTRATGKELLEYCKIAMDIHDKQFGNPQTDPEYILGTKTGICEGYLMSADEMQSARVSSRSGGNRTICLPPTYNLLVGATVVVKYLKDHRDQQDLPASLLVERSLHTYFPCMRA